MRLLGNSGHEVSSLALGTMTWGRDTDEHEAADQLKTFLDAGGNLIDTAAMYGDGDSEREAAPARAYVWAQVAARHGQQGADDIRALAVILMDNEEVPEADALVELCMSQGLASCPE